MHRRDFLAGAAGLGSAAVWPARAAEPGFEPIGPVRAATGVPALGGMVIDARRTLWSGVAGVRRIDRPDPVTLQDRWHIGSCGKSMTAALYAKMVETGRARWGAAVPELFPDIRTHPAWREVRVEELLSHRAGMGQPILVDDASSEAAFADTRPLAVQRRAAAESIFTAPQLGVRGKYEYSNFDYIMIGAAIERISGQGWEQTITRELFRPLGMASAGFGAARGANAWGHSNGGEGQPPPGPLDPAAKNAENPPIMAPAGEIHLTLADYARYLRLYLTGGGGYLRPETMVRMTTPYPDKERPYAMGWAVVGDLPWARGPLIAHDGSNGLWFTRCEVAPGRGLAIVTVANDYDKGSKACVQLAKALSDRFAPAGA